ncbi:MAG: carboxymuconolactone decarboxylase family protein [Alphaproteobacteria bacterium]
MSIKDLRSKMPEYAKDTKLNLGKVMDEDGIEGLSLKQGYMVALASAYATQSSEVIEAVHEHVSPTLSNSETTAAKAAATIMAMNNVYYRFVHLVSDEDFKTIPANLRMNIIGNPGVDKIDFELMSLAVSAINGCGMCIDAHVNEVVRAGISKQGIQSCIRLAAVLSAAAQAVVIEQA